LSAPGRIGAGCAASPRNTMLLHGRVFITARWRLIGGPSFTAYIVKIANAIQAYLDIYAKGEHIDWYDVLPPIRA
jgi:hypothetical protein